MRANGLNTEWGKDDVRALACAKGLHAIALPKVNFSICSAILTGPCLLGIFDFFIFYDRYGDFVLLFIDTFRPTPYLKGMRERILLHMLRTLLREMELYNARQ